jgi:HAD superfamily hydrolase (TIGR01509 family)
MKKKQIKAIVFDLGGVIMYGGYLDFIHHYLGKHLPPLTKKRIEYLERQVNLGTITENQFYRSIEQEFAVHLTPQQMHERIVSKMRTNKPLVKYLKTLEKPKIALFSNSIGHMALEMLKARHLAGKKLFDKIFLSNIMHLAKPSRDAYAYVVKHLKVKPSEALMVDDRKDNITAAKKAGMQGLVFNNLTQFKKGLKKYQLA